MKTSTITLQGTKEQISKVQLNFYAFPTEELPTVVETRVYALDTQDISIDKGFEELSEEEWITECERQGRVYTLQGFQRAFNEEEINTNLDVIKFISVPCNYELENILL